MRISKLSRDLHRWGSIIALLPTIVIIVSGIVLQLKKDVAAIQPPTQTGTASQLSIGFDRILAVVKTVPQAGIASWDDIDRLDVRPGNGMVKVQSKNRWEIQIDTHSGEILQVAVRRSDWIEGIHDGSYFHDGFKRWVFLPTGLILVVLVITGVYLFFLPYLARRKRPILVLGPTASKAGTAISAKPGMGVWRSKPSRPLVRLTFPAACAINGDSQREEPRQPSDAK